MTGWECPRCHTVWAPYIRTCTNCTPKPTRQFQVWVTNASDPWEMDKRAEAQR